MASQAKLSLELIHLMGENPSIQNILDVGYKYLNNPIHMTDLTGRLLARSRHDQPVDDIWEGIEDNGFIQYDIYQTTCLPNVQKIFSRSRPMIIRDAPGDATLLAFGLKTPRNFHANLIVFENERPIEDDDIDLLFLVGACLRTVADQYFPGSGQKKEACDYLICDLLDTPNMPADMLIERQRIVGFAPTAPLQILTICNSKNITSVPILKMTCAWAQERFIGCKTVIHNNRTITLLDNNFLDNHPAALKWILQWLEQYDLTAALSRTFANISHMHEYYTQTLHALEYGSILQPAQKFYNYEDYAIYRCLEDLQAEETWMHPCIKTLSEYDTKHKTEYLQTLHAYIVHLRSMRDAAGFLNIHYNTMKYRMSRIFELIDIDLSEAGTFFYLFLTFKNMELKGTTFKGGKNHETDIIQ